MADEDLLALAEAVSPPGPSPAGPADPLAARVRGWYLSDLQHALWKRYRAEAELDAAFYKGGEGQWRDNEGRDDDLRRLRDGHRATVSINHIKPVIKVLTGFERQTRFDLSVLPQGEEDEEDARLMSWLLKFVQQQAHIPEYRSQALKDGLIRGMSCLAVEIDYTDNVVAGDIVVSVLKPGFDIVWDPHWTRYDLSDANHVIRFHWAWLEDAIAQYPDKAAEIRAAVSQLDLLWGDVAGGATTRPAGDAYGSVAAHVMEDAGLNAFLYDPALQRVVVLEAWYPVYEAKHLVIDRQAGRMDEVPSAEAARQLAQADPERLTAIRRLERRMKTAVVLPATSTVLEDEQDSIYDNDAQAYPFVPFIAERVDDEISGLVRDLRDPQRVENKRISQALDLASRWGKIRRVAEENSIAPQSLASIDDPTAEETIYYRSGMKKPEWDAPAGLPQLVQMLVGLGEVTKLSIREISGVNTELQGAEGQALSGIAMARRQAQGQVIATEYFDNHRWTGQLLGQRLGRRIQQKFTLEEYVRLTNDLGAPVLLHLNPPEFATVNRDEFRAIRQQMTAEGKPPILRDVSKFKYDLVMSETPATPSARAQALNTLLEIIERVPAMLPVLVDKIIKLSDGIPDRHEILQRIAMMQGFGGGQPGAPGPGGPPPGAPLPPQPGPPGVRGVPGTGGDTTMTVAPPPPTLPPGAVA